MGMVTSRGSRRRHCGQASQLWSVNSFSVSLWAFLFGLWHHEDTGDQERLFCGHYWCHLFFFFCGRQAVRIPANKQPGHSSRPLSGLSLRQRKPGGRCSEHEGGQGGWEERRGLHQGRGCDGEELARSCWHLHGEQAYRQPRELLRADRSLQGQQGRKPARESI